MFLHLHILLRRIVLPLFALLSVVGPSTLFAQTTPATGGTVSTITQGGVTYRVHTFTTGGALTFTAPVPNVEYLVIGGGGGGGTMNGPTNRGAGGGGGGRFVSGSATFPLGLANISIGQGGAAGTELSVAGGDGEASQIVGPSGISVQAAGGGGGGGFSVNSGIPQAASNGRAGGSGGGGANPLGQAGQAIAGAGLGSNGGASQTSAGTGGAGGGGSEGVGETISGNFRGGNGGSGALSSITGSSVRYAGGRWRRVGLLVERSWR